MERGRTFKLCFRMLPMLMTPAAESDFAEIIELVNLAFRGAGPSASWNIEAGIIEGQRLNESLLREDLAAKPKAHLLIHRDAPTGSLLGTVWLEPGKDGEWYLGLLTVRPELQNRQLGRTLLAASEDFARGRGARCIRMTVVHVREPVICGISGAVTFCPPPPPGGSRSFTCMIDGAHSLAGDGAMGWLWNKNMSSFVCWTGCCVRERNGPGEEFNSVRRGTARWSVWRGG